MGSFGMGWQCLGHFRKYITCHVQIVLLPLCGELQVFGDQLNGLRISWMGWGESIQILHHDGVCAHMQICDDWQSFWNLSVCTVCKMWGIYPMTAHFIWAAPVSDYGWSVVVMVALPPLGESLLPWLVGTKLWDWHDNKDIQSGGMQRWKGWYFFNTIQNCEAVVEHFLIGKVSKKHFFRTLS